MESYNVLGLTPDADDSEVRKSYLKLAVKYHPDKGGDERKFQEITEAYHKILEERMGAKEREKTMKEIFEETFREVNAAFKKSEQRNKKTKEHTTKPVNRKLRLPLKDMWNGCTRKVTTRFRSSCADCDGFGRLGRLQCDVCDGTGSKNYRVRLSGGLVVANKVECKECNGSGEKPDVSKGICSVCRGTGK
jgi:DnaJ family protein A protein 2